MAMPRGQVTPALPPAAARPGGVTGSLGRAWERPLIPAAAGLLCVHDGGAVSAVRPALHERHQQVLRLIRDESWEAAEKACRELTLRHPDFVLGWYLAAQIAVRRTGMADALALLEKALALQPAHPPALLLKAQCLAATGRLVQAAACATLAQEHAPPEPAFWDALGSVLRSAGQPERALAICEAAVQRGPGNARAFASRAAVRAELGDLSGAEEDYDQVIALSPAEFEAFRRRSELRTQTHERNHITELEEALAWDSLEWRGEVQLRYALAKEYADLGEHELSFQHLQQGARLRREHMRYDVKTDVATVNWIREAFPEPPPAPSKEAGKDAPILIVGLPCSGSALVGRILGAHPHVLPALELDCFARALVEAVRRDAGGRQLSRREMVASSARVDFNALGRDYIDRAHAAGATASRFIDSMPLNYLYCGLIRRALPRARIVHVRRAPLAACFAIHSRLFEEGYPFSYDLADLGQYYIAYRRLMAHWQRTLPGVIHEVSCENMSADQLGETRRLLDFCGLPWDEACTPQACGPAPLPQPAEWRHHQSHLAALRAQLMAAGIAVEEADACS
jgi:tetratricopeptide (TPR) repeat protein